MDICARIRSVCPEPAKAYEELRRKHQIAVQLHNKGIKTGHRPWQLIFNYFVDIFGRAQTADLKQPPPPREVINKAIVYSTPGLLACIYGYYYCENGQLHNEYISITGPGGYGKSTYAILLAYLLGGEVYTKEDEVLLGILNILAQQRWLPVLVLDDIAAIISKYWYLNKKERVWSNFFKAIEYAKDFAGVVLITTRSWEGPAKRLRELTTINGTVKRIALGNYIIDVVEYYAASKKMPDYIDVWWPGLKIPAPVWQWMMRQRKKRTQILIAETILSLADAGELELDEKTREKLEETIHRLKKELQREKRPI